MNHRGLDLQDDPPAVSTRSRGSVAGSGSPGRPGAERLSEGRGAAGGWQQLGRGGKVPQCPFSPLFCGGSPFTPFLGCWAPLLKSAKPKKNGSLLLASQVWRTQAGLRERSWRHPSFGESRKELPGKDSLRRIFGRRGGNTLVFAGCKSRAHCVGQSRSPVKR